MLDPDFKWIILDWNGLIYRPSKIESSPVHTKSTLFVSCHYTALKSLSSVLSGVITDIIYTPKARPELAVHLTLLKTELL